MKPLRTIFAYAFNDIARSKGLIAYALFFALSGEALFRFGGGGRALLSLMNLGLIVIPLVCIVFGAMYLYSARDFMELLLAQPIRRSQLFGGLFLGLSIPLAGAFALGAGVPMAVHAGDLAGYGRPLTVLLATGILLSFVFVAIATLFATWLDEKVKGLAAALIAWLLFGVVYDGLMLLVVNLYAAYPLEIPTLVMTLLNPLDLARVMMLLNVDIAALMGYTGAVFEAFFGTPLGLVVALGVLVLWIAGPLWASYRMFLRKDF
ncbi:MAG: ABC transporter permease subunit [Rhodothermales bacterium]